MFKENILKGKKILVTGGGTGLGKEMSEHYVKHGAELVICGRRESVLAETANEFKDKYEANVRYQPLDIRSPQDVEDFIDTIFQEGPLHGLVNNAAGNFISPTKDLSARGFDAIANIVFHGTFYVTNAVGKKWLEQNIKGESEIIKILVASIPKLSNISLGSITFFFDLDIFSDGPSKIFSFVFLCIKFPSTKATSAGITHSFFSVL